MKDTHIRLPDADLEWLRAEAERQRRSVSGQIAAWIDMARALEGQAAAEAGENDPR